VDIVDMKLELVILPVTDVDRAKAFYEQVGFRLDVDHEISEELRVVQLTPPGSECSITIGKGMTPSPPGTAQGLHLVVTDIEAARAELVDRGIDVSEPFHFGPEGRTPGVHPERSDYNSFVTFNDPDGNGWLLQEVKYQKADR
jgi:catechol 2,3-dioxygenase-like lactoylglutathione lyase family enzyme